MNTDERKLIEACLNHRPDAQIALYQRYNKAMFNSALRILGNRQEAEDVMQEAFITAFARLGTFDGKAPFGSWLKKIVVNKSIDALRRNRSGIFDDIDLITNYPDNDKQDEYDVVYQITPEKINDIMKEMKESYRLILSLHLIEGYPHDQIAELLGMSYANVRTRYSRARKLLADNIRQYVTLALLN